MAAYTTELDCIRTFLLKVHTAATTKHYTEERVINKIADTERMLVFPGELVSTDGDFYWKRYKVQVSETGEAGLMTAINNIVIGINKFNKRTTITDFAYASASKMCHMKFAYGNKNFEEDPSKRWSTDIYLDVEWSTS